MGQQGNSGRNASLDQKKTRAAGRQPSPRRPMTGRDDFDSPQPGQGRTKGAFGGTTKKPGK